MLADHPLTQSRSLLEIQSRERQCRTQINIGMMPQEKSGGCL